MSEQRLVSSTAGEGKESTYTYVREAPKEAPAPAPAPARAAPRTVVTQPTAGPNKALILVEMAILFGGTIAVHRSRGESWLAIWTQTALRSAMATVFLLAVLLTLDDLGAGAVASLFGGLIVLGYFLVAFGVLGPSLLSLEQAAFGVSVPAPISQAGSVTSTH